MAQNPVPISLRKYCQIKIMLPIKLIAGSMLLLFLCCASDKRSTIIADPQHPANPYYSRTDTNKLKVTDAEWKKVLPDSIYRVAREKNTEYAFTGKYWNYEGIGTYYCAACGNALFKSDSKFASSCGWPSFFETLRANSVVYQPDNTLGMERTEVLCGRCGAHLGHLFDDGPPPTGKRYCMNSIVLDFEK